MILSGRVGLFTTLLIVSAAFSLRAQAPVSPSATATKRPELVTQLGQLSALKAIAFSPDGRVLLTGGETTAVLWDAASGRELRRLEGHTDEVIAVAFSPNGRLVATADKGHEDQIRIWDPATGREVKRLTEDEADAHVTSIAFSAESRYVLTTGDASRKWDISGGQKALEFKGEDTVFLPDSLRVLTAQKDRLVLVDASTKQELHTFSLPRESVVCVSPDGRLLVIAGGDEAARLYHVTGGNQIRRFEKSEHVSGKLAFSPNARFLVAQDPLAAWDVSTGRKIRNFEIDAEKISINAVAIAPSGEMIALACGDRSARTWSVKTGGELRRFDGVADYLTEAAFTSNGRFIITQGGDASFTFGYEQFSSFGSFVWDTQIGHQVRRFFGSQPGSKEKPKRCEGQDPDDDQFGDVNTGFSPDANIAATVDCKVVHLFDAITGREIRSLEGHTGKVASIDFSPDGTKLLTSAADKTTRLWDIQTGGQQWVHPGERGAAMFMPDARRILVEEDEVKYMVDARTGSKLDWQLQASEPLIPSPDGRFLIPVNDTEELTLRDGLTGKEVMTFEMDTTGENSDDETYFATFSPDGKLVAALRGPSMAELNLHGRGHHLRACLWDAETGKKLRCLKDKVSSVSFSPDSRFVLTASYDRTTRLWDAATAEERCRLISFRDGTWVVVDPDGRFDTNNLESIDGLHWVFPESPFIPLPLEVFMREYYEPRLLTRILAGEKFKPVRPLATLDRRQPSVKILKVTQEPGAIAQVTITVEVGEPRGTGAIRGATARGGVYNLRLFRDGQLVGYMPPAEGRLAVDPKSHKAIVTFTGIKLPSRMDINAVEFSAYAFNQNKIKSPTDRLSYTISTAAAPVRRTAYVLTVAVAKAQNPAWGLLYPDSDAERVRKVVGEKLRQSAGYDEVVSIPLVSGYEEGAEQVVNLPTKRNIKTVLDTLAGHAVSTQRLKEAPAAAGIKPAKPEDLILVVFSGHGYADGCGNFFLLPFDTGAPGKDGYRAAPSPCIPEADQKLGFNEPLLEHAISDRELSVWLRDIDAGDVVMIVDACHAAAAVEGREFKPGPMGSRGLGQLSYDKGMQILAASQAKDVARAGSGLAGSILIQALIQDGLEKGLADFRPADHRIMLDEWLQFGSERVSRIFSEHFHEQKAQEPALFDFTKRQRGVLLEAMKQ